MPLNFNQRVLRSKLNSMDALQKIQGLKKFRIDFNIDQD